MAKQGQPTKYRKEYNEQARRLCIKGFIDTDLADFFGVHIDTIYEWKKVHPSFSESLKDGKKYIDSKVMDSLYNRAIGFETTEVKDEEGTAGKKKTVTTRQVLGDTTAQIFWLKNRQPELWRNNPEREEQEATSDVHIHFTDAVAPKDD